MLYYIGQVLVLFFFFFNLSNFENFLSGKLLTDPPSSTSSCCRLWTLVLTSQVNVSFFGPCESGRSWSCLCTVFAPRCHT